MFLNILVAVDGSAIGNRGLRTAIELAVDQHAVLHVVHVVEAPTVTAGLEGGYIPSSYVETLRQRLRENALKILAKAERLAQQSGVPVKPVLVEMRTGSVARAILHTARKLGADVIVLGTHGRRGLQRALMGSDAEAVLREARCPVLLVRSTERKPAARARQTPKPAAAASKRKAAKGPAESHASST
jgi:nucleotide-binding universal stress UspA family protein